MLSIAKLAADQSSYYLDQARARVDVVESVAGGVEDYYGEGGKALGAWTGRAAARLRLGGPVASEELRALFAALHPRTGQPLRDRASRVKVAAYDLTFSAPKSVSVLFGTSDPAARVAVRDAHEKAVREAVTYLERSSAAIRRGAGGAIVEQVDGFIAGGYRHRASRERGTPSCTRTSSSRTSGRDATDAGRRWTGGGSTLTRTRRAASTRQSCAAS
jgi:conjugative relaxase-like TrwC/TraI family protein